MNRYEYMQRLTYLLKDLPAKDQEDAINYYNDYFDDAQVGLEDQVADTLDAPEVVAQSIAGPTIKTNPKVTKKPMSGGMMAIIIILIIILFPLWLPLVGVVFGLGFGIFATIFALVLAFILIAFALVLVGFVTCGLGAGMLFGSFPLSITLLGLGVISIAFGLLIFLVEFLLCFKVIPWIFNGFGKLYRLIFKKGDVVYE